VSTSLHAARIPGRLRQRLVPTAGHRLLAAVPGAGMTVEQLRAHFQTAVELEHSTLPPYLCALYTMDAEKNAFAYQAIQGVVMEEMLHMIQAANILTAIGGSPELYSPKFIPEYPTYLPHSDDAFLVPLQKFSKETLREVFLKIEMPKAKAAPPQPNHYHTIGQFYMALRDALIRLGPKIFTGNPAWQVTPNDYYGGGGGLLAVYSLDHALQGIDEIIGQGEGIDGTIEDTDHPMFGQGIEYAHYFRFNEVLEERQYRAGDHPDKPPTGAPVAVDWTATDMKPNPKMKDYPVGSPLWRMTLDCNKTYMKLLHTIQVACTGAPQQLRQAIPVMYDLKYKIQALMNVPLDDGSGQHAGPSFEYVAI
jgi:hypothetical protein